MKALAILVAATSLLLSGCATTLHSNVTVFHEWPSDLQDKSYSFETPSPGEDTLEFRSYQNLVSGELAKLGFTQAATTKDAKLRVAMQFSTIDRPVKVLTASDPWMYGPGPWGYYPRWGYYPYRYRYYGFYRPYYDPWMWGPMEFRETIQHNYDRNLRVTINNLQGKKLYDVTVQNTSRKQSTPLVMPALVQSAFTGFPGESGKAKRVDLELQ
ncbi:DUF4136 domain-containing protein [Duganella sp. Root198D2]|uniref:DUF4136 domain-containing protein n=1 Tax=Duganella sp. Root198D2 TaxID=1736489 RepID=UPI000708E6F5|nr:DUF4136 domain-containing protein [Duganella sp. Root198D2]KRB98168.1 hypothetical protein ASE26_24940 [Duganella sp. Root198D2]